MAKELSMVERNARGKQARHDVVKQSIERLAKGGTISLPPMGEVKVQRKFAPIFLGRPK